MSRVYISTGGGSSALSNAVTVRAANPRHLAVQTSEPVPRTSTRKAWAIGRLPHPKAGAPNVPASKRSGDPIVHLDRTRNAHIPDPSLPFHFRGKHPAKKMDLEGIGNRMPIQRESENSRKRRHLALQGERRKHIAAHGGKVRLGNSGSGLDFYKGVRIRPALPDQRADVSAATRRVGTVGTSYLQTAIPEGTQSRLALEGMSAEQTRATSTRPPRFADNVDIAPVAIYRAHKAAAISGDDTATDSLGRFAFLAGAVFVAWLVLRK